MNLYTAAYECLMESDVQNKRELATQLYAQWQKGELSRKGDSVDIFPVETAGRPEKPKLVQPSKLKKRSLHTDEGRAALLHAVTHIEFNAINLALDAVYRFREMPDDFYGDWLKVAAEEAYHYGLLNDRLQSLDMKYGDLPAHNGLCEMTVNTRHDVMVRMALVPRVLEARGLDVTPGMMQKLEQAGDHETVDILKIILRDEIGHVAIGSRWFHYCCEQRDLEPLLTFRELLMEYMREPLRGPLYTEGRLQAGFTQDELDQLLEMERDWIRENKSSGSNH